MTLAPETMAAIEQQALDHADREYARLVAVGWSRRDAARYSRDAQRLERSRLIVLAQTEEVAP